MIIGVGLLTAVAYMRSRHHLSSQTNHIFREATDAYAARLVDSVEGYGDLMYATKGLHTTTAITAPVWSDFMRGQYVFERYPGLQVIGYARLVGPADKASHTAQIKKESPDLDFTIHPAASGKQVVLDYIDQPDAEAAKRNPARGFDLLSEPVRKAAIEQAEATGSITATAPISLVGSQNLGFLLVLPLPTNGATTAYSVFAFDLVTLIEKTLKNPLQQYNASLTLKDVTGDTSQVLYSSKRSIKGDVVERSTTFQIANRQWEATFQAPAAELQMIAGRFAPIGLLAGGIVIMLVVAVGFYSIDVRKKLRQAPKA